MAYKSLHIRNNSFSTGGAKFTKRGVVSSALETLVTWQARASMRRQMADLDQYNLKDMGLTAHQVEAEIQKPFWQA
ncbi:MAG: hypothetical protein JJ879_01315 [Sneathiella sp.]|nr:hypothetical protein [Sneathiella sp.]